MKRRTFKLLLFVLAMLVGGAIINVAVAWGCCLWPTNSRTLPLHLSPTAEELSTWKINAPFGMHAPETVVHQTGFGYSTADFRARPKPEIRTLQGSRLLWLGFPIHSLYCESHAMPIDVNSWQRLEVWSWNPLDSAICPHRLAGLPFMPLWPGFAINMIFYTALLWMLFAVPGAVRRRVRRKRGQCGGCGYSMRESVSEKCPECGTVVSTRSTA